MNGDKWAAGIAMLLSIIAIYLSLRNDPITIDFEGAILVSVATIISIPTAIVIGWQIFVVIDIKKKMQQFKEEFNAQQKTIEQNIKNIEEKYYQRISEIDKKFKKIDTDNLEVFAYTYRDFAEVISSNIKPLNKQKIYAIVRCSVLSITAFAQANKPKESDEMIEFLCKTIYKETFDTLDDKKKQKVRNNIKQCSNWDGVTKYDELLNLIYYDKK